MRESYQGYFVMISNESASFRRAIKATVCLFLAVFGACDGFLGVATGQQPSVSMKLFDNAGHPIGAEPETTPVRAAGFVVDAETSQPLPAFYVTSGTVDRERPGFDWAETNRQLFTKGAFKVVLNKERLAPAVLIEADGYLPQCSGPIRGLETNMNFRLKKGNGPGGVVLTPDGRPAAGRTVYFSRLKDLVFLEGPSLTPKKASARVRSTVTDGAGRFSFAPDLDGFGVMVADDTGFAETRVGDLKSSSEIRLQPWARVEGTLRIGTRPAPNETVRLATAFAPCAYYPRPVPPYSISVETTTDNEGRFFFPRVPPVDVKIFHAPKLGQAKADLIPMTQITNLTPKAGETNVVTLGGEGRPIVGRVVLKNYQKPINWQGEVYWIDSLAPEPADCPNFDAITREYRSTMKAVRTEQDKDAAQDRYLAEHDRVARQLCAYYSSPAGRRYWFGKRRYVLRFAQDGSFRIDDVPGGKYELTIDLRDEDNRKSQLIAPVIALHRQEVDVPDAHGGRSDTPLDLGDIRMAARLIPGEMAPDFAVKTVDNKTVKLSDYRGKNVLLDFWATSNAPSVAETSNLKETYAVFKNDPRFAMIGLSLDPDMASVRDFSVKNQMNWTQGWLGLRSESDVPDRFGVENIPLVLLIDPAGRVLASGLRGGTIKSTVDAALSASPQ
jgi:thiol-disulfide isomerase/thioredoxin